MANPTKFIWLGAIILTLFLLTSPSVLADSPPARESETFTYTVQPGDTLLLIALRHNLNLTEIALINNLKNPSLIFPGQTLLLPGLSIPEIPVSTQAAPLAGDQVHIVKAGDTIFSIANSYGVTVGDLILLNNLLNPDVIQVGQTFKIPVTPATELTPPEAPFVTVTLSEPTVIQGRTLVVRVTLSEPATLLADFEGQSVFFHNNGNLEFWGIVAIHALIAPNRYPLTLMATLADGRMVARTEYIEVIAGPYGSENIRLTGSRAELLQSDLIRQEREKLTALWSQVSPRPRWEGPFWYPVADSEPRVTSYFGTRRVYNDSPQPSFHGGTDFGGDIGSPIYAPAAGTVVLAEPLTVRGNAVLIDHGMGLYSGYWHQSQVAVIAGQEVQPGDLIGYLGDTGLVTGPHLHWELRLNGIAVNPLQWVRESLP